MSSSSEGFHLKMLGFLIFCHVWIMQTVLIRCSQNSTVMRFSVPEDHHVLLRCGSSDSTDVVWTHQNRRIPVSQPNYQTNDDQPRYFLLSDGSLHLLQIDDSDSGEYHCNQQLVAELQVLTGRDFTVSAGWTLLLPCSSSSKHRERWYHRREGEKREVIFTIFRNGTMKPERETGRLSYEYDALQIKDLQREDAGQYQCNTNLWTTVTVLSVQPEPTSIQRTASTTATPAVMTEVVGTKKKEKRKRLENVLLLVAVVGLAVMILLMAAVCVLLISIKCRRRKKKYEGAASTQMHEDTELQLWKTSNRQTECKVYETPSQPEETIHYASLGQQNWREMPSRTSPDQNHHSVIYSSIITRPANK